MGASVPQELFTQRNRRRLLLPPILVAGIVLLTAVIAGYHGAGQTGGRWVFALDDSYIHLAMGRTLAEHGIWGVTPLHFSATSSAPLYTLLLAGTFLLGVGGEVWAWVFSIMGGVVTAYLLTWRACRKGASLGVGIIVGLACCAAIWLPEIIATGMEHTLHISAVLIIAMLLERRLAPGKARDVSLWLAVVVFIAAGLRYETLFLILPLCWILWRSNMKRLSVTIFACGIVPAIVLGSMYLMNGEWPLPNSVLLKGVEIGGGPTGHLSRLFRELHQPSVFVLFAIAIVQLIEIAGREKDDKLADSALPILYILTAVAHVALARPDRRYLGYLLALGIWSALPALIRWYAAAQEFVRGGKPNPARSRLLLTAVVIVSALPFTEQFLDLSRLPRLGQDIYAQQIQMARFLSTQFPDETVALNDIGATAWAGKNDILDLWGLADNEVARLRLGGEYGPEQMERIARERHVRVVAIYSHWFLRDKGLPEQWTLVGRWQIPGELQVNSASNAVDFFATSPDAVDALRQRLQTFSSQLPPNVRVIM